MRSLSRRLLLGAGLVSLIVAQPAVASAAEVASSDVVIIREGVVIDDDLYATGVRVIIEGEVTGDLIAFAAEDVVVEGVVGGSVTAVAQDVQVSGRIGNSLRTSATHLTLTGSVGKDVIAAVVNIDVSGGSIGGDIVSWSFGAAIDGSTVGDVKATARRIGLQGMVGGDVEVTVGAFTITGPLTVGGDLAYRSRRVALGTDQIDAGGVVVHKAPLAPNIRVRALWVLARALVGVTLTMAAVMMAYGWPSLLAAASNSIRSRWLMSFGLGLAAVLSPILVLVVAWGLVALVPAAASLPLLAILIPVALALLGLVMVLSVLTGAPVLGAVGRLFPFGLSDYGRIVLGGSLVTVLWMIPWIGWLVPLLVIPLGAGGWISAVRSRSVGTKTRLGPASS